MNYMYYFVTLELMTCIHMQRDTLRQKCFSELSAEVKLDSELCMLKTKTGSLQLWNQMIM
jgi:hypothetical protein